MCIYANTVVCSTVLYDVKHTFLQLYSFYLMDVKKTVYSNMQLICNRIASNLKELPLSQRMINKNVSIYNFVSKKMRYNLQ